MSQKPIRQMRKARWVPPSPEHVINIEDCNNVRLSGLEPAVAKLVESLYEDVGSIKDAAPGGALFDIEMYQCRALEGDEAAARELHDIAVTAVLALNIVAKEKPDLLRALASKQTNWPALFSYSPLVQTLLDKLLQSIGFATKLGSNYVNHVDVIKNLSEAYARGVKGPALTLINSIQNIRTSHTNAVAISAEQFSLLQGLSGVTANFRDELYQFHLKRFIGLMQASGLGVFPRFTFDIVQQCARLPDFSSEKYAITQWWDAGYELLMLNTTGQPQKIPVLHAVGRSREKHYSGLKVTAKGDEYKPDAVKSNVRAKILTDLREEFGRLANQLEKTSAKGNDK